MPLNMNQFNISAVKGMVDLKVGPANIVSCEVDTSSAGNLVPGQAVKIVSTIGGIPNVVECSAASDDVFGIIAYDIKSTAFGAGDKVEIAFSRGTAVYMEASAAISANAKVMIVLSGQKVATATTGNMIVGRAFDAASASGDLIRIIVDLPGSLA
jgi:hypothetical protein